MCLCNTLFKTAKTKLKKAFIQEVNWKIMSYFETV